MKPVFFLMQICPVLPGSLANGLWDSGPPENLLAGFHRPWWSTRGPEQLAAPRPWVAALPCGPYRPHGQPRLTVTGRGPGKG